MSLRGSFFSRNEIAQHNSEFDYWIIMGNKVYSFQNFNHPGGWAAHAPFAGGKIDATQAFSVRHGYDGYVKRTLNNKFIGYDSQSC